MTMSLGYIGINASDLDAWERFGTEIMGLESLGRRADGALVLRIDTQNRCLVLHQGDENDVVYAGWEVSTPNDLTEVTARLQKAGVAVHKANAKELAARGVSGLIRVSDPDGLTTEIFYGPSVTYEKPFRSPRPISGFVTGNLGLGHLALATGDIEAAQHFYCDLLGFRISDYINFHMTPEITARCLFLHCNPRHHSLAFVPVAMPKHLLHFMVEVKTLDDVGFTWDLAKNKNIPIPMDFGRHSNDHTISFYMQTPSGFEVEFGTGGRQIDDNTWSVEQHEIINIWGGRSPSPASIQET